jgi:hypothetical protein
MKMLKIMLLAIATTIAMPAIAQDKGAGKAAPGAKASMNMEILRDKLKADKKLIVANNMDLTDAEAKAFWPIYDGYQKELGAINDQLTKTILAYADAYNKGAVSNETAKKLLGEALAIEEAELKLKRSYVPKLEKALPEVKVARYMQIENKIRAVVKYGIADSIPLVQ